MSKWYDLSNNANKLRQSYVSGFLDISGGGVYLRSDNSLNLYSLDNDEVPKFSIKAQEYRVRHGVNAADVTDVSNEKLRFLVDLSENVQDRLEDLIRRTKFLDTNGASTSHLEDVSINQTLRVADVATFESKIHAISDVSFDTTLNVDGATTLKSTLGVDGVATFNNTVHAISDASFDTTLNVDGATTLKSTLGVDGVATFNNTVHAVSDASFDTTLNVDGATTLKSTLGVDGVATFNNTVHAISDISLDSTLRVDGATTLNGDTLIDAKLAVSQDASFNSVTQFAENATFDKKIIVDGDASLNSTLNVAGASSLKDTLMVDGATTLKSTLGVDGVATFNNTVHAISDISLDSTLRVDGATTLNGDTLIDAKLAVSQDASFNSVTQFAENATFDKKIIVNGDASLNENLIVKKEITADRLNINKVHIDDNEIILDQGQDLLIRPGGNSAYDNIGTNSTDRFVRIIGDLKVDGSINFTGDFIKTDTIVQITEQMDISNDGSGPALVVTQHGAEDIMKVMDDLELALVVKDGGMVGLKTNDPKSTLGVSGGITVGSSMVESITYRANDGELIASQKIGIAKAPTANLDVSGTAAISGATALSDTLIVTGATTLSDTLAVTGATTLNNTLQVAENTTFDKKIIVDGDASLNSTLNVAGASSLKSTLDVVGATTLNSTLDVTDVATFNAKLHAISDVSFDSTLRVDGATTLNNATTITGPTSINNKLAVAQDASFNKIIQVAENAIFDKKIIVDGDASLNAGLTVDGASALKSSLNVVGATALSSTLGVADATTLSSTLDVTGAASLASTLDVTGATTLDDTLDVSGVATFKEKIIALSDVSLNENLIVGRNATIQNNLVVNGGGTFSNSIGVGANANISGTLDVIGATTLNNTLDVVLDASFGQKMQVHNDVSMNKSLTVQDDVTTGLLNVDKIHINDNYISSDAGQVLQLRPGGNTAYDNNGTNSTDHKVHITGDLVVDGSINFTGDFIKTDTIVKVTEQLDVSNDGTGPVVVMTQYGHNDIMKVLDGATLTNSVTYKVTVTNTAPYFEFRLSDSGPVLNNAEHPFILVIGTTYTFVPTGTFNNSAFAVGNDDQPDTNNLSNSNSTLIVASSGSIYNSKVTNSNNSVFYPVHATNQSLTFTIPPNYSQNSDILSFFDAANVSRKSKFSIVSRADSLKTRMIIKDGGFIGIGTDAPTKTLDVNGAARIRQSLTVEDSLSVSSTLTVDGAATLNNGLTITSGNLDMSNNCYINQVLTN